MQELWLKMCFRLPPKLTNGTTSGLDTKSKRIVWTIR